MREVKCDVLVVGGGTGGVAAALAATAMGLKVILTEETDWIGGQLTSQAVPPDEHPWIEQFGCTSRYRTYRNLVRKFYRDHTPLLPEFGQQAALNPGTGWVSALCHEPRIGWQVLNQMVQPAVSKGLLEIRLHTIASGSIAFSNPFLEGTEQSSVHHDQIESVALLNLQTIREEIVQAKYVIDATELGDLLPLTGTEYVVGAESKADTHEPNAVEGPPQPNNQQGFTWVFAMGYEPGENHTIQKPEQYESWRSYKPDFWPGQFFGFTDINPQTGAPRNLPIFSDGWFCLFKYRQIVEPKVFQEGYISVPVTIVNWPQNDYFIDPIVDVERTLFADRLHASKQLSLSLLYWLQTEAPNPYGNTGYPGLHLRPNLTGTEDGFAKTPYIRESRRLVARTTITEQQVAAYTNPDQDRATEFADSVGIGAYRIDLHPSTSGTSYIDTSSLPFQIPLGALIPVRMRNLIAACKNIGSTHITNGCYRLHPVEWNIGEAAGLLAAFCIGRNVVPSEVHEKGMLLHDYQALLRAQGIELEWPKLRAL